MQSKKRDYSTLYLLALTLLSGCLGVVFGKELNWDLANYHYYNPYVFLENRYDYDYWPNSFLHLYLNPALDLFNYYLINHFKPMLTVFILGCINGLNLWLLYWINSLFLSTILEKYKPFAFFLVFLGLISPNTLQGLGSFQNDLIVSLFILSFFLLFSQAILQYQQNKKIKDFKVILSAILLGIGIGLKLTTLSFLCGAAMSLIIMPIEFKDKLKLILYLTFGAIIGITLSSGYWMYFLWHKFQNPIYPFFNNFFQSEYFDKTNVPIFPAKPLLETVFYPFYFSTDLYNQALGFLNFRYPITFIILIYYGISIVIKKQTNTALIHFWLFSFIIVSYLFWLLNIPCVRYIVTIDFLIPLLVFFMLYRINRERWFLYFFIFSITLIFFAYPMFIVRGPYRGDNYFNVAIPKEVNENKDEAITLIAYSQYSLTTNPRPQNFLIPKLPKAWRFVGIPFSGSTPIEMDKRDLLNIKGMISKHDGPFYLLTDILIFPYFKKFAFQHFQLTSASPCYSLPNDRERMSGIRTLLCPMQKRRY